MIKLTNLEKIYRTKEIETVALENVNLDIQKGEFLSIMGPSGCGKSTLLNILGLLDNPTEGSYKLLGQEVADLKEKERTRVRKGKLGFVFQSFNLIDELNVYENIVLPVELDGDTVDQGFMDEVVHMLALEDKLKNMPNNLSGGQQQRVAIARALAKNPKILLCDEPTGALDYQTGKAVLKLLQDTCIKHGVTVVVITHNLALTPMGNKVIRVKNGVISDVTVNENPVPIDEIEW